MTRYKITFPAFLVLFLSLLLSCSKKDSEDLCSTCPETDPAAVAAMDYVNAHKADFDLRPQDDDVLIRSINEDSRGWKHVRMDQTYRGIYVVYGELIVHLDTNLEVTSVTSATVPGVVVDTRYKITSTDALKTALAQYASDGYTGERVGNGALVVLRFNTVDRLCWWFVVNTETQSMPREYYIDAHTGTIVYHQDLIRF